MNKKVFDVVLEWIPRNKGGRAEPIPIKEMRYAPHIGINGSSCRQYVPLTCY